MKTFTLTALNLYLANHNMNLLTAKECFDNGIPQNRITLHDLGNIYYERIDYNTITSEVVMTMELD